MGFPIHDSSRGVMEDSDKETAVVDGMLARLMRWLTAREGECRWFRGRWRRQYFCTSPALPHLEQAL